jgi:hypothetical protein
MNELLVNQDCGVGVKGQDRHDMKHSISQVKGLAGRFAAESYSFDKA